MEEQGKINKDTVAKVKEMDKILENIDSKVAEVGSLNHQVINTMRMLETQVSQLAGHLSSNEGKLLGQPMNPETAKAIQTRSGRETEDPEHPTGARKPKPATEAEMTLKEKTPTPAPKIKMEKPEFEMVDQDGTKILPAKSHYYLGKTDEQFEKSIEVVRRLNINMQLLDALQVPTFACYFKDILTNKGEIPQFTTDHIKIIEECSAATTNQAPEKKRDPGCPTIPCSIGTLMFERALCDLGTSVSVMPKAVFKKLRLSEPEPTAMCLELVDNSIRYPEGIANDIPVKIGNHFVPVDFVILETGEGAKSPLILKRPFLKTTSANIDIGKGEIKFDINGIMSTFKFCPCLEEEKNKKAEEKMLAQVAIMQKKEEHQPVKTKKIAKLVPTSKPKMVKKLVQKTATPTPSAGPK
ncbi:hypothetical protein SETIT_5G179600v2 [Setaria italica]|uniref:Aspartic peptidase DDI1-type domain-containing protein n=1 Tax=Setaria italica TaxID=4555 RepID=A0A368R652_SETIT|nr:hypothetical protein SETIT_5G179600v2 [Setaria italica]